jgi:alkylation response protein AidB-like acyl-CoA dehydrogenase
MDGWIRCPSPDPIACKERSGWRDDRPGVHPGVLRAGAPIAYRNPSACTLAASTGGAVVGICAAGIRFQRLGRRVQTQDASSDTLVARKATKELLAQYPPDSTDVHTFLEAQFDAGLAWVHNAVGDGGLGLAPNSQLEVNRLIHEAGGPSAGARNPIGHGMCGPAIAAHGNDAQRELLRPLFAARDIWCQLFSEPGAGSDVASLSTRAVADGDEWVVNGQKVWTTLAHEARYGLLIARTDPEVPKHRGLTAFLVDMGLPGVEVVPLRQMTGDAEFNEVYFSDVRIPDTMRLDEVGRGWPVAITTLMNERVSIGGGPMGSAEGPSEHLLRTWRERGGGSPVMRDRVARLWIESEVNRLTNARAAANRVLGTPGPEGSVGKLALAENVQGIYEAVLDMHGPEGMGISGYDMSRELTTLFSADMRRNFLRSRATSIEGGSSEVLRNILAERVLGLPGDVRTDRDRPWSEVPRS